MSKNQADEQPMSARSEILSGNPRGSLRISNHVFFYGVLAVKKRSYQSQTRRSASQRINRPSGTIHYFDIIFYIIFFL
jgi:hypothetical protein